MYQNFATWEAVLDYIASQNPSKDRMAFIYYLAPMDRRPTLCWVRKVFKNGKLRMSPTVVGADDFTADAAHLERMWKQL